MKYKDFYSHIISENTTFTPQATEFSFIDTGINNGIKLGTPLVGDGRDNIRASLLRVAYRNKIKPCIIELTKYLFSDLKFKPIDVDIIFSVIKEEDAEFGEIAGLAYMDDSYITIKSGFLSPQQPTDRLFEVLAHEWAHVWLFKQKSLQKIVEKKYKHVKANNPDSVSSYGLRDYDEFWAYLIENYKVLDKDLKDFADYIIKNGK